VRPRAALFWAVALFVTAVFGYLAVRNAHPDEVWSALQRANPWWIVPSLAFTAASVAVRAVRWRYLFGAETRPDLGPVTSAMLVGLALNNLLPFRAGEAARILALGRRAGTSRVEILATVALERVLDVFCLLLLLLLVLPWLPEVSWIGAAAAVAVVLAIVLGAAAAVFAIYGDRPFQAFERAAGRLPFVPVARLEDVGANLGRGLAGLRRGKLALLGLALTTFSWVLLSLAFWLLTPAFDLGLPPVSGVLVLTAVGFSVILPAAPGALGVFEAAVVVALRAYDVPTSEALSYALALHALNWLPYMIAGAIAVRFTRPPR